MNLHSEIRQLHAIFSHLQPPTECLFQDPNSDSHLHQTPKRIALKFRAWIHRGCHNNEITTAIYTYI